MQKKEHYRGKLPHFQQPGQWYFITCSLEGAMPKGAMQKYSLQLEVARNNYYLLRRGHVLSRSVNLELANSKSRRAGWELEQAKRDYNLAKRKFFFAYDKILNLSKTVSTSLVKENNRLIIEEALKFWEGKRLTSHAWCIMTNHFHWILTVFKNNEKGKPVYLQDILHSVKLYSARRINRNENLAGQLWMHESFDTTIRNDFHFVQAMNYTMNNPVIVGLVKTWEEWPGTFVGEPDLLKSW